jgi:hypothetical protein
MDFFEQHGIPAYLIVVDPRFEKPFFQIIRPTLNLTVTLTEDHFIKWIDDNLDYNKLPKPIQSLGELLK